MIQDIQSDKLSLTFWSKVVGPEKDFVDEAYDSSAALPRMEVQILSLSGRQRDINRIASGDLHKFILFLAVLKASYYRFYSKPNVVVFSNTFSGTEHLGELMFSRTEISQDTTPQQMLIHLAAHFNELLNMSEFDVWKFLNEKNLNNTADIVANNFKLVFTRQPNPAHPTSPFNQFFICVNWTQGLKGGEDYLEFRSSMESPLLEEFVESYAVMLDAFTLHSSTPVAQANIISSRQQKTIESFSMATTHVPAQESVMQMVEACFLSYPEKRALVSGAQVLTYSQLRTRVNQLANFLLASNPSIAGERIGVSLSRSHRSVITMLAIFRTGACYVPLDRNMPASRLKYLVDDVRPTCIIIEDLTESLFAPLHSNLINLDKVSIEYSDEYDLPDYRPQDDAYIVYTSGSTGQPKGIRQTYLTLSNLTQWQIEFSGIEPGLRFLQYASFTFDVSIQDVWFVLASGGELHITNDDIRLDFDALKEYILAHKIEVFFFPYSVLGNFFNKNDSAKLQGNTLRHIISGSEQVFVGEGLEQFLVENPTIKLHNQYGPSETHVVTSYTLDATNIIKRVPIGKPISNTRIYILDENKQIVPIGVIGEIYVAGYNLANGYWNLPKNTDDAFIELKINSRNERVYRTGDFAKWLPDGNIAYLGRGDDQVKIRGFRVELSEISRFILQQEGVRESVVVTYENSDGQKEIVAFVIPGPAFDATRVEDQIASFFPDYMVPKYIIPVDSFPLTPNGKLNKSALQSHIKSFNEDLIKASAAPPSSQLEVDLLGLFREVLNNHEIGVEADFFRLGGDSMRAIRLVGKIKSVLGIHVEVQDVYNCPSVRKLATKLRESQPGLDHRVDNRFEETLDAFKQQILTENQSKNGLPNTYEDFFPIADIQFGMFFHSWKDAGLSLYHDQNIIYLQDENFDYIRFSQALDKLVQRHEILRTSFAIKEFFVPLQIVHQFSKGQKSLSFVDLTQSTRPEQEEYLTDYARHDLQRGFDISKPGLFRVTVFQFSRSEYGILLVNHHAILDGWSYASMMTELSNVYFTLKEIPDFSLPKLTTNYKSFVKAQFLASLNSQTKDFWKDYMAGHERTELPFGASLKPSAQVVNKSFDLDASLHTALVDFAKTYGYSFKEIFLAAFVFIIKFASNTRDVTIGLVSNARHEEEDADKVLGCFLNTIPFRFNDGEGLGGELLVSRIHEVLLSLKRHDKLPLSEIAKACQHISTNGNPFYDILFDYVDFHIYRDVHRSTALSESTLRLGNERPNGILQLQVQNHEGKFTPWWIYRENVFTAEQVNRMSTYFIGALKQITNANQELDTDRLIPADEFSSIKQVAFSQLDASYPVDWKLTDAFNKSVKDNPHGEALVFGAKSLTYMQLDQLSNKVAAHLQDQFNVRSNELVGLMMQRSELLIIGMLGILKAGGAYVPIDPKYPDERKNYIVQKSSVRVIVCDRSTQNIGTFEKIMLAEISEFLETESLPAPAPLADATPDDLAYVIFTSGSTGKPKGVKITHRNAIRLFLNSKFPFRITSADRWLCFHSECFDFSVWEIFGPLTSGGTLVLAATEEIYNIDAFLELLIAQRVTILSQTPTAFANWVGEATKRSDFKNNVLRYIVFGGEALNPSILSKWTAISPGTKLINMYGITETTVHVTYKEINPSEIEKGETTAGAPLPTLGVLILGENGKIVPKGTRGEIAVIGLGVAAGYLDDDELTSKKFVTTRYWTAGRCYLSGDIARLSDNNEISYIGRKDNQVKIRGYRIELGEIEIALNLHPQIQVAKVLVDSTGHSKILIAYYVSTTMKDVPELFSHLRNHVPAYMIPSKYVRVDKFKFNENGKLDVRDLTRGYEKTNLVKAPLVGSEQIELGNLWAELLGTKQVFADDNFFEIGGNSLKAAQLVLRIKQDTGKFFTIRDVFEFNTLREQAELLKTRETQSFVSPINSSDELTTITL